MQRPRVTGAYKGRTKDDFINMGAYHSYEGMESDEEHHREQCEMYPALPDKPSKHPWLREYERIRAAGHDHWYVEDGQVFVLRYWGGVAHGSWHYRPIGIYAPVVENDRARFTHLTLIKETA